ncbi:MAG: type II CRISPR RNA-guided endonuclease Cas9, partial [Terriglobales bacterium]
PAPRPGAAAERMRVLGELDARLRPVWIARAAAAGCPAPEQTWPYFLRAAALDQDLKADELGRALYHLGQRRGFKSNRREGTGKSADKQKAADERSKVKKAIGELAQAMETGGARTLGEHLARQQPAEHRIRTRSTRRDMFEREFDLIWARQAQSNPQLTPTLRAEVRRLLFHQRPLKSPPPGRCELERQRHRAPMASLHAQRFRMLQRVNDLRLVVAEAGERALTAEERERLLAALGTEGSLKFTEIRKRKLADCPRPSQFNLERGGETRMPGDRTTAALRPIFGATRWDSLTPEQRDQIVSVWLDPSLDDEHLKALAVRRFGLSGEQAAQWAEAEPEDGYCKLSRRALARLLPLMEQGVAFKTAEQLTYPQPDTLPLDQLPPAATALPPLGNPAVARALAELRKLVNALVREHGKPGEIRVELARDLKRNAAQREAVSKAMRKGQRASEAAAAEIQACNEVGLSNPSSRDVQRWRLWRQSCGLCPYCGGQIGAAELFGGAADIDHILPISRFPDDSFGNKCVAHRRCNVEKVNRTPLEAFGHDAERWAQILDRVKKWDDPGKLERFLCAAEDLDLAAETSFASRRLNETRYTTSVAAKYLGLLYGGRDALQPDGSRRRTIFATSGVATATLRRGWGLESILRQPEPAPSETKFGKARDDHRHHAVDAVVIALTSNSAIQQLSHAAAASAAVTGVERVSSRTLEGPWSGFVDSVAPTIQAIAVSHRPVHKLSGQLHNETNYSKPHAARDGGSHVHVRKLVHQLTAKQIAADEVIVDPSVRLAVRRQLAALGGNPKAMEADPPRLRQRFGREAVIRAVRVRALGEKSAAPIAAGERERRVQLSGNHHIALFTGRDRRGKDTLRGQVVSRLEAARRQAACRCGKGRRCDCVVRRQWEGGGEFEFLFSLMGGDMVEMDLGRGPELFPVRVISESASGAIELDFVRHTQAAQISKIPNGEWIRVRSLDKLRRAGCRKVEVDVVGRVREAHG